MSGYSLSQRADRGSGGDLYRYTYRRFGEAQADSYLLGLEEKLLELAENPSLALSVDDIRPGYRKALYQKHAVYFQVAGNGIFVVRVLHQQMYALLHLS
jgi:toxin ParE1/3/4